METQKAYPCEKTDQKQWLKPVHALVYGNKKTHIFWTYLLPKNKYSNKNNQIVHCAGEEMYLYADGYKAKMDFLSAFNKSTFLYIATETKHIHFL